MRTMRRCEPRRTVAGGVIARAARSIRAASARCVTSIPRSVSDRLPNARVFKEFTAPYAMFAVPLACLLLFALCVAVCQMDLCPRRRRAARHFRHPNESRQHAPTRCPRRAPIGSLSRSRGTQSSSAQRTGGATQVSGGVACVPRSRLSRARFQELLIAEDRALCRRGVAYPQGVVAPYVIRLDTIPHFNPHMIGESFRRS